MSETSPTPMIRNENVYAFDVDQTLVLWDADNAIALVNDTPIRNPYDNRVINCRKHVPHIQLLKQMKARGRFIIVWSAGGVQWANTVVQQLELEKYVDLVMTKPIGYVDDVDIEKWIAPRIFINHHVEQK